MTEARFPGSAAKIVGSSDALAWRRAIGGPVVFTNGVFDLLHAGHVAYLEDARAMGSALIVGLNSDASVRSLAKGTGRPFVPEAERARVVAGLAAVDRVVLFDDPTPLTLIESLAPDVLAKGADYTRETVVGADFVESHGGRVALIPLVPHQSTTSLAERIRGSR